jgi:hypothetical protein
VSGKPNSINRLLPPHTTVPPHWPVAERMARTIAAGLPPTLIALWVRSGRGTLVVTEGERPRFESASFIWRDVQAQGVLFVSPRDDAQALWQVVGAWLDAFGGSFGGIERLSDGHGATPLLTHAAARLKETLSLGYAKELLGSDDSNILFPRAVAAYQTDPQPLSAADPLLTRWLRGTLFNEGFWRNVQQERYEM